MKPHTVVHVVLGLNVGGLERVVVNLVRGFQGSRFRHVVVCLETGGLFASEIEQLNVPVHVLHKKHGVDWTAVRQLARLLRQEQAVIVHTHNPAPHFYGVIAALLAGVPIRIHTKHGRNYPDNSKSVRMTRLLSWFTDVIVPVSDNARDVALQVEKVNPKKVQRIWNGVDVELYKPHETGDYRLETIDRSQQTSTISLQSSVFGLQSPAPIIGTVARLSPEKDQQTMLQAFNLVLDQWEQKPAVSDQPTDRSQPTADHKLETSDSGLRTQDSGLPNPQPSSLIPQLPPSDLRPLSSESASLQSQVSSLRSHSSSPLPRLILVGDGPCMAELRNEADRLGIAGQVDFLGARSDIPTQLSTFDIFTLSSTTEGISMTILEAMACGLPVVATDVGGNREIVNPPECGLIVPPRDPGALAGAYLQLLRAPSTCALMGTRARTRIIEQFSLQSMAEDYSRLYKQLLTEKGRG